MEVANGIRLSVPPASQIMPPISASSAEIMVSLKKNIKKKQKKTTSKDLTMAAKHASNRGTPKPSSIWKISKERFATVKKTKQRLAFRDEIKQIKELSQYIKGEKKRENEENRLRREENKQRRLTNARKSEIVQIISNPAKLKRMRTKQWRMIEKRDISQLNVV